MACALPDLITTSMVYIHTTIKDNIPHHCVGYNKYTEAAVGNKIHPVSWRSIVVLVNNCFSENRF